MSAAAAPRAYAPVGRRLLAHEALDRVGVGHDGAADAGAGRARRRASRPRRRTPTTRCRRWPPPIAEVGDPLGDLAEPALEQLGRRHPAVGLVGLEGHGGVDRRRHRTGAGAHRQVGVGGRRRRAGRCAWPGRPTAASSTKRVEVGQVRGLDVGPVHPGQRHDQHPVDRLRPDLVRRRPAPRGQDGARRARPPTVPAGGPGRAVERRSRADLGRGLGGRRRSGFGRRRALAPAERPPHAEQVVAGEDQPRPQQRPGRRRPRGPRATPTSRRPACRPPDHAATPTSADTATMRPSAAGHSEPPVRRARITPSTTIPTAYATEWPTPSTTIRAVPSIAAMPDDHHDDADERRRPPTPRRASGCRRGRSCPGRAAGTRCRAAARRRARPPPRPAATLPCALGLAERHEPHGGLGQGDHAGRHRARTSSGHALERPAQGRRRHGSARARAPRPPARGGSRCGSAGPARRTGARKNTQPTW